MFNYNLALTAGINTSKSAFVKGVGAWVTLGLNIRLKGYVNRQHLYTVR